MGSLQDVIKAAQEQFQRRLDTEARHINLGDLGLKDADGNAISCALVFPPATSTQADKILKIVQDGAIQAAQIEAIIQRARTPDGKKAFSPSDRTELAKWDPQLISAIAMEIGAFEDIEPNVGDAEKNSTPTPSSERGSD